MHDLTFTTFAVRWHIIFCTVDLFMSPVWRVCSCSCVDITGSDSPTRHQGDKGVKMTGLFPHTTHFYVDNKHPRSLLDDSQNALVSVSVSAGAVCYSVDSV